MVEFWLLGEREHQAHATAVEEAQPGTGIEQMTHSRQIAIEGDRTVQVVDIYGDLSDLVQG